ncbi:hypothetical protein JRQ81_013482 [Phrynocephalus forsythii]|uniref:Uncharacterized protein n=1 Tax=Phrynocephalus forsythii TaxID=171643 RepID=A0A9Q0Y098_9SAUR|nr:hypothetical protein JRQ81_013482 [Phrynocephalus forsythii]
MSLVRPYTQKVPKFVGERVEELVFHKVNLPLFSYPTLLIVQGNEEWSPVLQQATHQTGRRHYSRVMKVPFVHEETHSLREGALKEVNALEPNVKRNTDD